MQNASQFIDIALILLGEKGKLQKSTTNKS